MHSRTDSNRGIPPPKNLDNNYGPSKINMGNSGSNKSNMGYKYRSEDEYFEGADSDEEIANTHALKVSSIEDEDLEYIPAPNSPSWKRNNVEEEIEEDDPLDAYMSGINKMASRDMKATIEDTTKHSNAQKQMESKGRRQDIEEEDEQESFFRYMEENPMAGVIFPEDDEGVEIEYDEEGNPIIPEKLKIIDPLPQIDHSSVSYPSFAKNFYNEHEEIIKLSLEEVKSLRLKLNITVNGADPQRPVCSFAHLGLADQLINIIRKMEYVSPTPIQAQAIPCALSGRDVIGIAKTGSGKTLAYLLPLLIHILDQPECKDSDGAIGIVLVPTRELAHQVRNEAAKLGKVYGLNVVTAYGGGNMHEQQLALKQRCEIVIATPGRLIDLVKKGSTSLLRCTFLVLDEADKMLDLGFEVQVRSIMNHIRPDRQTLVFSATFPRRIERLCRDMLIDAVKISDAKFGELNKDIKQRFVLFVNEKDKLDFLCQNLVALISEGSLLIFVTKKANAIDVFRELKTKFDEKIKLLHGDLHQSERNEIITTFRRQEIKVLIATDVASRGLDIAHIKNVVNFEPARNIDTHIHRIGRTGRAGQSGTAFTLLMPKDKDFCGHIVRSLEASGEPVPRELLELATKSQNFKKTRFGGEKQKGKAGRHIGGAGLGYTENASKSSKSQNYDLEAGRENKYSTIKSYFKQNYGTNFIKAHNENSQWQPPTNTKKSALYSSFVASSSPPKKDEPKASSFQAPNFLPSQHASDDIAASTEKKRRKKSRWED